MNHSRLYFASVNRMRELREITRVRIRGDKFGEDLLEFSTSCNGSLAQTILAEQALEEWMDWASVRADRVELLTAMEDKVLSLQMPGKIRIAHNNVIIKARSAWKSGQPKPIPHLEAESSHPPKYIM